MEVEVNLAPGLPAMSIVGLPDAAVKESGDRVTAAIKNTGLEHGLNGRAGEGNIQTGSIAN